MHNFTIQRNEFLSKEIQAFYHTDYVRMGNPGNPDCINILKNTYDSYPTSKLNNAVNELKSALIEDWDSLVWDLQSPLTICVVPRAKTKYSPNQLLFKSTIRAVIKQMNDEWKEGANSEDYFIDGTDYIIRNTNTKTTHLPSTTPNYKNDGEAPYAGITKATCRISNDVRGKNILLIDDIYTKGVNIDEDAIQALLDNGANSVTFYAVGRTVKGGII